MCTEGSAVGNCQAFVFLFFIPKLKLKQFLTPNGYTHVSTAHTSHIHTPMHASISHPHDVQTLTTSVCRSLRGKLRQVCMLRPPDTKELSIFQRYVCMKYEI
ncbi:hypothetical protein HELRODRAFT_160562 [Helobdella robusta]|uniref:Uncharacterized protein n=1 Tax=Helobdella robusta TaxID=6412 RepID=T1EQF2_HELRO|nr:hypothetical protein HELRODRAFT_160562 [Helobdella robusta]ESO06392.1 hypothetical protein HELRODRAFT_160562 [Helobdella robusta]